MKAKALSSEGFMEVTLSPASSCSPELSLLHKCRALLVHIWEADSQTSHLIELFNVYQTLSESQELCQLTSPLPKAAPISHPRTFCSEFLPSSVFLTSAGHEELFRCTNKL